MTGPVRQMGYLLLASPDPATAARDLVEIAGLKLTAQIEGTLHLSSNERDCEICYLPGPRAGLVAVGLEVQDGAAIDALAGRLQSAGLGPEEITPPVPGVARALRFRMPSGPAFDVHTPVGRGSRMHHIGPGSRMRRLEHVNLRVRDTRAMHDLLTGPLGMKLSDRTAGLELAWYRAGDGVHHTIAVGQGDCLHHYAFEAVAVADLVRLADTLAALGRGLLWGLGRHGAGDNLFAYYRDPDGAAVECSVGMERIANDAVHAPRVWDLGPDSRVRNLWETSPPPAAFQSAGLPFL